MAIFKKKSKTQNLEPELATLRQRVQALETKRQAAEAELTAATEARQLNLIEGSLDDTKTAQMLQDRVNIAASAIVGFEDAISVVQVQIAEIERKLDAERTQAARTAAADTLARDLDSIEKALPLYLDAAQRFADAVEKVGHFHFESGQAGSLVRNVRAQIEVAVGIAAPELRAMVSAIREGSAPIPPRKPEPAPVTVAKPTAGTRRLFSLRPLRWTDAEGRVRHGQQFEDCELTPIAAQRALRLRAVCGLDDPRRRELKGARGGHHVNTNALDLLDLDAEEHSGIRFIDPNDELATERSARIDPVTGVEFVEFRGPARVGQLKVS